MKKFKCIIIALVATGMFIVSCGNSNNKESNNNTAEASDSSKIIFTTLDLDGNEVNESVFSEKKANNDKCLGNLLRTMYQRNALFR
jgi:ABC-type glycerol-3-phosphate transport system substrate-binding protein